MNINILNRVNGPEDVKKLSINEMKELADEVREAILNRVSNIGGHVGPNLGITEATIAMHYVFNSPIDKIVFDVSHQSYPHKILTGRKEAYLNPEKFDTITGYTEPSESEHDMFIVGHTSTSVSLACGLAKARDLKNEEGNVIAVIGDGSMSGGEAFEGFDNAAKLNSNIIIVVNDNDMSIAENHGGIYDNLKLLRETDGKTECNMFKALGFDYYFVKDGNDVEELIKVFTEVKNKNHPIIVHMVTKKGKGYKYAEENKEKWHWNMPFNIEDGSPKYKSDSKQESYQEITANYLVEKAKNDSRVVAITPAIPVVCGFSKEVREKLGKQYVDVGIAEEHAVAFASGLAKNGAKPVIGMHSSFIQRTYDQLSQDLAINNSPAVILIFGAGISYNDVTHLGVFDMTFIPNIPNIVYLAPTCKEEYLDMLDWGIEQNEHPVVIRVPSKGVISKNIEKINCFAINKAKVEYKGSDIAIIGAGDYFEFAEKVKEQIKSKFNIDATLINPRYISGLDKELLESLKENHKLVITLENGVVDGGFGEKVSRYYGDSEMKVLNYGARKEFTDKVPMDELNNRYHLTKELIVEDIKKLLNK